MALTTRTTLLWIIKELSNNKLKSALSIAERYSQQLPDNSSLKKDLELALKNHNKPMELIKSLPRDIQGLLETSSKVNHNVFVSDKFAKLANELAIEWKNREIFGNHNLPVRNKILFYGESGSGKTTLAKYLAELTNLPFIQINGQMIVESLVGKTGQHISKVFMAINEPTIVFWDEFDSVAAKRQDTNSESAAAHENDRTVNALLVNLDTMNNNVIFLAATNRKNILDDAILRRFDVLFSFDAPLAHTKKDFIDQMQNFYGIEISNSDIGQMINLKSFAEIKFQFEKIARAIVLQSIVSNDNES